jgi:hypothetical protein
MDLTDREIWELRLETILQKYDMRECLNRIVFVLSVVEY